MAAKTLNELQIDLAVLEERLERLTESASKALVLQAEQYEKHLALLNHEAEQLKSMQASYVSREVYDRDIKELDGKVGKLNKWADVMTGRIIGFGLAWGVLLAIIQWYLKTK